MGDLRFRRFILLPVLGALVAGLLSAAPVSADLAAGAKCKGGSADGFPCHKIDLVSQVPAAAMGGGRVADVWGWVDPETKNEYAILGTTNGVQFLDVTDPTKPVYLGRLPVKAPGGVLIWQELEILNDTAYIVCDLDPCGLQIFDLNRLRGVEAALPVWRPDVIMPFGTAHSIDSNPKTEHLFLNGPGVLVGTPVILDVSEPLAPKPVGVIADDGYTHDSLCRNYRGPDKEFRGNEICFNFNEDSVTIFDVTANPQRPVLLSRNPYDSASYTHSGALTKDHSTLISTDEGDETDRGLPSTLYIWDVSSLVEPKLIAMWHAKSTSIDHNIYSEDNALFHANYTNGFRILDLKKAHKGKLKEVAWFDTMPTDDTPSFAGAWAAYPFLPSGNILVGHMGGGLFILRPQATVMRSLGIGGKRQPMSSL